ncbi:hypothetical protein GCM10023340_15240 [Nocardioides marinquilinus]|uniref:PKD domain-containing protein n=1 Tax=Nocardioides marinquilinus TaxID=1210400 RepID=A0ABP9PF78_9ACTN
MPATGHEGHSHQADQDQGHAGHDHATGTLRTGGSGHGYGYEADGRKTGDRKVAAADSPTFQKVTLNDRPGEPMDLAVLPNSDVLHTTRAGVIWRNDARTGVNSVVGKIDVYNHDEEGLQSIALDPNFSMKKNNWVYLYYSPPLKTPKDDPATLSINEGDAPLEGKPWQFKKYKGYIQLSKFKYANGKVWNGTERKIMQVPVDRGICCHVGGDIVFDSAGNLLLATGDDSNPFESDGFAPLDERAMRNPAFDAQRTAANTNDLRGKILRIKPKAGAKAGYTIPKGNLFKKGTPKTKPQIYAMGLRNPFRIEINPRTDDLYVADYSPDANTADPKRGPAGHGKWAVIDKPSNYGWPYCATRRLPYNDYNFATEKSGKKFNCKAPVNTSVHNTGLRKLPPVVQPEIWYTYPKSKQFPLLGEGGISPMAGPAYQYDKRTEKQKQPVAWPRRFSGTPLLYEWSRDWVRGVNVKRNGVALQKVIAGIVTDNPMDMEFGPDGALYILEYGDGYFAENPDAQLSRVDFLGGSPNRSPKPKISADPVNGKKPLKVQFSSKGTKDPDGDKLRYKWDFNGDGKFDATGRNPVHTYKKNGLFRATLTVTDVGGKHRGRHASADIDVLVGNQAPVLEFVTPTPEDTFEFGDVVQYEVKVTDDQPVDCNDVTVTYILGHATHGHPQSTAGGCTGSLRTTVPGGHDPATDDLSAVFVAQYSDGRQAGSAEVRLQPSGSN